MPTDVIMPMLGMNQETGKVLRWLKAEGEVVAKGEALAEVETDKVTVEVEAPADGVLGPRSPEGEDVPVGEAFALILAPGEESPAGVDGASRARADMAAAPAGNGPAPVEAPPAAAAGRRPLASPKARRIAAERGIELAGVAGSGPHGAVLASDVEAGPPAATPAAPQAVPAAALEVGAVWERMAHRLTASWQSVPHFFLLREVDAGRLQAWREALRAKPGYEALTVTDLLVKLCAAALAEHPRVNASWQDGRLVAHDGIDVGVAVATGDALIVPVVHGADRLGLQEIGAERSRLVEAARSGRLRPEDVQGGTFTISNLGMYGVDAFLAIVNAPQAAILAVGRIVDRVVAVDGAPAVRPMMTLALSFDHRVVDGARGAEFLDTLAGLVEEPAALVR
ncbi:MAG TPA: dihydrolipoamide acetyltransferase family protein [Gaiellaceae bacterium]|nr:dihydrolipoamide acetyltransferase family protein [Gaiellaceae bacterium]